MTFKIWLDNFQTYAKEKGLLEYNLTVDREESAKAIEMLYDFWLDDYDFKELVELVYNKKNNY